MYVRGDVSMSIEYDIYQYVYIYDILIYMYILVLYRYIGNIHNRADY